MKNIKIGTKKVNIVLFAIAAFAASALLYCALYGIGFPKSALPDTDKKIVAAANSSIKKWNAIAKNNAIEITVKSVRANSSLVDKGGSASKKSVKAKG